MGHGQCSPHLITRHWSHSKAWGQSGTPCNAALWCQPLPKHSADPPASNTGTAEGQKLSGVRRCLHVGREASPEHRVKGSGPCQTAAHPHPHNPRDRECQHHARLSQDKTRGLYLLGMARARLPQGSSAFTSY